MFTGIIEEVAIVQSASSHQLTIDATLTLSDLVVGDSISVNGTCLTAVALTPMCFTVDLSEETLQRTNLGFLKQGHHVDLERALAANARMGGHIVQGHVDGVGVVVDLVGPQEACVLEIEPPPELMRYVVKKGFIAVDGISLTVADLKLTSFTVAVIPYTLANTVLRYRKPGDPVNLEVDILAKYVERLLVR